MAESTMIKLEELGVGSWVTVNSRVVRGHDWSGGEADGAGEGEVTKVDGKIGVVSVRWNNGNFGYYRMGAGGKFELKIAPKPVIEYLPPKPTVKLEEEEEESEYEDSEEEAEEEEEVETEREEVRPSPPVAAVSAACKVCEYCGGTWTDNSLSSTICVECTAKLWRGEIVNKNNEFEKYDKIAFIKL